MLLTLYFAVASAVVPPRGFFSLGPLSPEELGATDRISKLNSNSCLAQNLGKHLWARCRYRLRIGSQPQLALRLEMLRAGP